MQILDDTTKHLGGSNHKSIFYEAYVAADVPNPAQTAEREWRKYCQSGYSELPEVVIDYCLDILAPRKKEKHHAVQS